MAALAIANEKEQLSILADAWLGFPPFRIDRRAQQCKIIELAVNDLSLINIAGLQNTIRPVAYSDHRRHPIASNRERADVLHIRKLCIDLGCAPMSRVIRGIRGRETFGNIDYLLAGT